MGETEMTDYGRIARDTSTNPGFQPFGFAGGLYDTDTILVRFGARDYLPEHGIWSARDALPAFVGVGNHYNYVFKDPPNHNDPQGLQGPCGGGPSLPQTTGDWLGDNIFNEDDLPFSKDPAWQSRADRFMAWFCGIVTAPSLAGSRLAAIVGGTLAKIFGGVGYATYAVCTAYALIRAYQ